eukprot:1145947-Pelagomonas_calceolata.AAC.1
MGSIPPSCAPSTSSLTPRSTPQTIWLLRSLKTSSEATSVLDYLRKTITKPCPALDRDCISTCLVVGWCERRAGAFPSCQIEG